MKRALDGVIAALGRAPGDTVNLLVGEPCFQPPAEIRAAFRAISSDPASGYGPPAGFLDLRRILSEWRGEESVDPGQVVVTHGAKGGLLALLAALVEPGDEVIHPLPCYPAYPAMVRRLGGITVGVAERGRGFSGWAEKALASTTQRTRAVILSSPSNPSGSMMTRVELSTLVEGCRERGLRLMLDEAYADFVFDEDATDPGGVDPGYRTLIRVRSASKSLALCGWRIGWIVADSDLARRVTETQSALLNPPATPPQRAMLRLPDVPGVYFDDNRGAVEERLAAMTEAVRNAGFHASMPAGGFYLWIDIRDRLDEANPNSEAWCERLAEEHGVGLWPGEDYGTSGWVRLAIPQGNDWRETVAKLGSRMGG